MRDNYFRSLDQQLQAQHMSYDDYVEQQGGKQQFSMMVMMQVREMLVEGYALDALFAHEGLATTDADYLAAAQQINPQGCPQTDRGRRNPAWILRPRCISRQKASPLPRFLPARMPAAGYSSLRRR